MVLVSTLEYPNEIIFGWFSGWFTSVCHWCLSSDIESISAVSLLSCSSYWLTIELSIYLLVWLTFCLCICAFFFTKSVCLYVLLLRHLPLCSVIEAFSFMFCYWGICLYVLLLRHLPLRSVIEASAFTFCYWGICLYVLLLRRLPLRLLLRYLLYVLLLRHLPLRSVVEASAFTFCCWGVYLIYNWHSLSIHFSNLALLSIDPLIHGNVCIILLLSVSFSLIRTLYLSLSLSLSLSCYDRLSLQILIPIYVENWR